MSDYRHTRIDGHDYWANPATGRVHPYVAGADEGEGDPPGGDEERTFTQADVDRLVGRARTEARRTSVTEVAEQLGCTVDEAKQVLDAVRAADAAQQTDAQRALAAAQDAQAAADQARAEAAAERLAARVERRLLAAGVPDTALARAARMVDLDPDVDDDAIDTEIDQLKSDVPALFTPATGTGTTPPPNPGAPPRKPPANGAVKTARERAEDRFKNRPGHRPSAA